MLRSDTQVKTSAKLSKMELSSHNVGNPAETTPYKNVAALNSDVLWSKSPETVNSPSNFRNKFSRLSSKTVQF